MSGRKTGAHFSWTCFDEDIMNRRAFGLGLLAAGAAGTAGVAVIGPQRIEALLTGSAADPVTLWGFIGGEKLNFLRNDKVKNLLRRRYGVTLDARRAGSVEMVIDPALIGQKPQFLWPASNVLTQLARRNGLPVRRDEIVLNSPLVIYSWSPIVEALQRAGYVEERNGAFYLARFRELVDAIIKGTSWKDIGVGNLFGRILISSTDPTKSNSGFAFAGLLANLLAGDVASPDSIGRHMETIAAIFERMGYKESSSGTHWSSYLNEGMGGKPLLVGYESQLIEFILGNAELWQTLQAQPIRPVMLYPVPTIYSSHPIISLAAPADRLVEALSDPEIQELAWSAHGFRGRLGRIGTGGPSVKGIAPSIDSITPMPDAALMLALVERLGRPRS
jgi:hypothetical protein